LQVPAFRFRFNEKAKFFLLFVNRYAGVEEKKLIFFFVNGLIGFWHSDYSNEKKLSFICRDRYAGVANSIANKKKIGESRFTGIIFLFAGTGILIFNLFFICKSGLSVRLIGWIIGYLMSLIKKDHQILLFLLKKKIFFF
jgi:hypothetical protein